MWTKQPQTELSGSPSAPESRSPGAPLGGTAPIHPSSPTARNLACLGSTLEIKGESKGPDLATGSQANHRAHGPVEFRSYGTVIVCGKAAGNIRARDHVEIKKDAGVVGDITTARISVEDGASFKGRIEIERAKAPNQPDPEAAGIPVGAVAN